MSGLPWREILAAPVLAMLSPPRYAALARERPGAGIAYLAWVAVVWAALGAVRIVGWTAPEVDGLVAWVAEKVPVLHFEEDGVTSPVAQPYVVTAQDGRRLLLVDTAREVPEPAERAEVSVLKRTIVLRDDRGGGIRTRTWDTVPTTDDARKEFEAWTFDPAALAAWYRRWRGLLWAGVVVAGVPVVLAWKLLAALLYGGLVAALHRLARAPVAFATSVAVACFAMTPVLWFQTAAFFGVENPVTGRIWTGWAIVGLWTWAALRPVGSTAPAPDAGGGPPPA